MKEIKLYDSKKNKDGSYIPYTESIEYINSIGVLCYDSDDEEDINGDKPDYVIEYKDINYIKTFGCDYIYVHTDNFTFETDINIEELYSNLIKLHYDVNLYYKSIDNGKYYNYFDYTLEELENKYCECVDIELQFN